MAVVYLHVGAPKTGTTYLQDIFFHNREAMVADGVLYPAERFDDHFLASVDLQDLAFYGARRPEATGRWERVAASARSFDGTVVVSHDVFAGATAEQARRAMDSLRPAEVHIVYTARDLGRQVPSQWQEDIKHGCRLAFEDYLQELTAQRPRSDPSSRFWRAHDPVGVLRRWGSALPPARVHLVTVPKPGSPRTLLEDRFAHLLGLDLTRYETDDVGRANAALGIAETEFVRRINTALGDRMPQRAYEHIVKGTLAHRILDELPGAVRPGLPPKWHAWFADRSREQVERLRQAGYEIVGDLADLIPGEPASRDDRHPDGASDEEVAATAVHAAAELLLELERARDGSERDVAEIDGLRRRLDAAEARLREHDELPHLERLKRAVVEIGRRNSWVDGALNVYRRARAPISSAKTDRTAPRQ